MPPKKNRKRKEASDGDEIIKRGKRKLTPYDLKDIKDMINFAGFNMTYLEIQQGLEEGTLMSYLRKADPDKTQLWDQLEEKLKTVANQGHSSNSAPTTRRKSTVSSSEDEGHGERDGPEDNSLQQIQTNGLCSIARDSISVAQGTRNQGKAVSFRVEEDPPITKSEYREMMSLMTDVLKSIQRVVDAVDAPTRVTASRLQVQPTTHVTLNQPHHHVTINQPHHHAPPFIQQELPPRNPQDSLQNGTLSPATTSYIPVRPHVAAFQSDSSTISQSKSLPGLSETSGSFVDAVTQD